MGGEGNKDLLLECYGLTAASPHKIDFVKDTQLLTGIDEGPVEDVYKLGGVKSFPVGT